MQRFLCNICDDRTAIGYVFFRDVAVCRGCRDYALTYLSESGVDMTEENPFIAELCIDSHAIEPAWFQFYNSAKGESESIKKLLSPENREGLIKVRRHGSFPLYVSNYR